MTEKKSADYAAQITAKLVGKHLIEADKAVAVRRELHRAISQILREERKESK